VADELDVLLDKVDDPALRAELRTHVERLRAKRSFGLVFEDHLPERVRLPEHPVRRGVRVVRRDEPTGETLDVLAVRRGTASVADWDGETATVPAEELVVVAEFGQTIHPGLQRVGSIDRGGDKPAHVVINAENHHALEMLQYTHAGKVDCIYIDPPYNTGARDWKYDNDYVDSDDAYRHSKWLAFMQRRLLLAKQLLNPENSVLIVTIDEKEVHRLGLLLEQLFAGPRAQMVSVVITPSGQARGQELDRVDEHVFFLFEGAAVPARLTDDLLNTLNRTARPIRWESLLRSGTNSRRVDRPNLFFPVFVDAASSRLAQVGEPKPLGTARSVWSIPDGTFPIWPLKSDGAEGTWQQSSGALRKLFELGYARLGEVRPEDERGTVWYLGAGLRRQIEAGAVRVDGKDDQGAVRLAPRRAEDVKLTAKTVWNRAAHHAGWHGSNLVRNLVPGRSFPFPKSLYAVEDALRIAVKDKPDAVVLDFFAGSGTTAHAVARLNRQDGGRRQSILVTNNEVSADEAKALTAAGHRDGDAEWEALGIFEHITRPRLTAAITGRTPAGDPVKGDYRFTDEFPMADGFEENVEFLRLTYVDPLHVELDEAFAAIAPLLWLRAGGQGPVIESRTDGFASTDRYGILFDPDRWRPFVDGLPKTAATVFVVTDSPSIFAGVAAALPSHVDAVRLYESYLQTFAINRAAAGR